MAAKRIISPNVSAAMKKVWANRDKYTSLGMLNKKCSQHTKDRVSAANSHPLSEAHKLKLSLIATGRPRTESAKENIRLSRIGMKHSKETCMKLKVNRANRIFPFKDTKIEVAVQSELLARGIDFIPHKLVLPFYQCDIFIEPNIVVECDGDFWHAFPGKYNANDIVRHGQLAKDTWAKDARRSKEMVDSGYIVLRYWEHEINSNVDSVVDEIEDVIMMRSGVGC